MAKKCKKCGLLNLDSATECASCGSTEFESAEKTHETEQAVKKPDLDEVNKEPEKVTEKPKKKHWKLILGLVLVMLLSLAGNVFSIWFAATNLDKNSNSSVNPKPDSNSNVSNVEVEGNDDEKPDRTAPVIKFAEQTVKVVTGSTFAEGDNVESVVDDRDGVLNEFAKKPQTDTAYYICVSKKVDTSAPGEYTVTYNAYDLAGNKSEKSYKVIVADEFYDAGYLTSLNGITQTEKDRIKGYADNYARSAAAKGYQIDTSSIKYEGLMLMSIKDSFVDGLKEPYNYYMVVYSAVEKSYGKSNPVYYVITFKNVSVKDDGSSTVVESEASVESNYSAKSLNNIVGSYVTSKTDKYEYELGEGMEAYDSPKVN